MPRVELVSSTNNLTVEVTEQDIAIVPSGDVTILVRGAVLPDIRLDGRARPFQKVEQELVLSVDLTRSVGFHHLHIAPGHDFFFGSQDAKLQLDGVVEMLSFLRGEGLGWSGQLIFSDGGFLRDSRVIYGWLDARADALLHAAEDIAHRPRRGVMRQERVVSQGGKSVAVRETMALLRRRGAELLEEGEGGPVTFEGRHFYPRKVVANFRANTLDTPANRRVVWLMHQIALLVQEVAQDAKGAEAARCEAWLKRAQSVLHGSALSPLSLRAASPSFAGGASPVPAAEELTDARYALTFRVGLELHALTGWSAQRERRRLYSYVGYADEIYQMFVAYVVAAGLGLQPRAPALGLAQPAFASSAWEMYYNMVPPKTVLRSWRSYTNRPDNFRPDLLLRHLSDDAVVVCDAKYRSDGARASESSRKDVMAYMAAFDLSRVVIFYPPHPKEALGVHRVAAQGREILEITVAPTPNLTAFLAANLQPALDGARVLPVWKD